MDLPPAKLTSAMMTLLALDVLAYRDVPCSLYPAARPSSSSPA